MSECPQCGSQACMSCEAGAELARRNTQLVEALTSAQHAIYILEAHIDFIADGQQPEEHDGGCIALAKSQCRDALATVSDTTEKE